MVSKSTLGRKRKEYENLATILKSDGKSDNEINSEIDNRLTLDAKIFGIPLADYRKALSELSVKPAKTRELDKITRDTLIKLNQDKNAGLNLAIKVARGEVKLTDSQLVTAYHQIGENANNLANFMKSAFTIGGMIMDWIPASLDKSKPAFFNTHIGGWGDGSKTLRYQYAPRKLPVSKRSGYRDDSFGCPIASIPEEKPKTEPKPKPKK
jgi:hypothetical protein